jgi:hypothetical protein
MALAFFKFLFVNIGFLVIIFYMVVASEMKKIKQQWPLYRCNPTYMFLADNIEENYKYCLSKTVMTSFSETAGNSETPGSMQSLQEKGFSAQISSNKNLATSIKKNNEFGSNVSFSLSDFVAKSGRISTIGTLFTAHFTGITGNLLNIVTSLSSAMTSGVSGLGVLDNTFSKYISFVERVMGR